ncbi:hypothetical protein Droror1_Dr00018866 [Drosera rotundifolia]
MPTMALPNEEKPLFNNNKPTHNKNNSGEIDVFEAAGYYAGTNDHFAYKDQKLRQSNISKGRGRASLDVVMPMRHQVAAHDPNEPAAPKAENITKHKKLKQPSSPGARISHFLNSLFNQKVPKKKNSSSTKSSMNIEVDDGDDDEEISPTGWRKSRRRSISSIWTATTRSITSSKSYSSKPITPPFPPTEETISFNKETKAKQPIAQQVDQESKDSSCGLSSERSSKDSSQEKEGLKEFDDGWDSDSSSDLFELQLGREFRFSSSDMAHGECVRRIELTTTTMNNDLVKS